MPVIVVLSAILDLLGGCFESDRATVLVEVFGIANLTQAIQIWLNTRQYLLDSLLAGDILYLSTAELILRGENHCLLITKRRYHRLPNRLFCFERWLLKLHLLEKS